MTQQAPLTRIEQAALRCLSEGKLAEAMSHATRELNRLRSRHQRGEWRSLATSTMLRDLRSQLHEDPYSRRGFLKPRGYAGDAVLVDYIYGLAPLPEPSVRCSRARSRSKAST